MPEGNGMRIVEVCREAELAELRPQWERLLAESASDTIFLTWEWVTTWWAAYGAPGELYILLAVNEAGVVRGIAPLHRRKVRRYGRAYPALGFIGDTSADSDYLDFIVAAGHEAETMEAFWDHLQSELAQGVLLLLDEIPESSPNLEILRAMGRRGGALWSESDAPCGAAQLPAQWPDYLAMLAPRFRTKVRSVLRNLEGRSDIAFRVCTDNNELAQLLPSLFDLHTRRWATASKPGVFRQDRKQAFYRALSPLLLDRGWLYLSWMEWRGMILACQYGFVYGNRYFHLQEGYEPACEHWSIGVGLRAWSIRNLLDRGVSEYDFLGGMGRHKSDWGAAVKLSKRVVLCHARPRNMVFCRGPEWEVRVRQSIKARLPQRFITAHDAHQERQRTAAFNGQNGSPAPVAPWIRAAAANTYSYSGLSSLLRPLRDQYRLQIRPNGALPHIGLEKRRRPAVRILYFHRVNNDGDPFFPAMPTDCFERQIRFVARHYRLVSLSDAVRRLREGGPPEPVVAITFDDGYRDNYTHALPILERYGATATIFLATGSIDSREPLWFEKLALAVKKTPHAFIDLELDIPRRIWVRDEKERLSANDQIYAILRQLPDVQRREWLDEILKQLGSTDAGERNGKMLTWDDVRHMRQRRIAFGGHTVTHPFVSRLSPEQAAWEFSESKRRIEQELQTEVEHFAYPSGREQDFAASNKELLRQTGYKAAVSTIWGVNHPSTDPLELRRGNPWEASMALFAAKFDWYQWVEG
jgi:peptidoglycan/xylan/chitin deacetylase (PgdA/CDA1 family)/CelD/BcsL family acetyltransferase involved in cellulose biosynthesis